MWFKEYRDYKTDKPLIKEQVSPSHGIIGCEMHDLNGWGIQHQKAKPKKPGLFRLLWDSLMGNKNKHGRS